MIYHYSFAKMLYNLECSRKTKFRIFVAFSPNGKLIFAKLLQFGLNSRLERLYTYSTSQQLILGTRQDLWRLLGNETYMYVLLLYSTYTLQLEMHT